MRTGDGGGARDRVGNGHVGLDAKNDTRRQHVVVPGAQSDGVAARSFEGIEDFEQTERSPIGGVPWPLGEPGTSGRIAEMSADECSGPIESLREAGPTRIRRNAIADAP